MTAESNNENIQFNVTGTCPECGILCGLQLKDLGIQMDLSETFTHAVVYRMDHEYAVLSCGKCKWTSRPGDCWVKEFKEGWGADN